MNNLFYSSARHYAFLRERRYYRTMANLASTLTAGMDYGAALNEVHGACFSPENQAVSSDFLPDPALRNPALFLDVDGTLSDIAPTPDEAFIAPETLRLLRELERSGVPVALISGRSIASVDALTFPRRFPAAGQHGIELRGADGELFTPAAQARDLFAACAENLNRSLGDCPQLMIENKGLSIAVHYRNAPELESRVKEILADMAMHHADRIMLQSGKMVLELRLSGATKGDALLHFMKSEPFASRVPVYIGDDRTDEHGFMAANAAGGISIKVGCGPTNAHYRVGAPAGVKRWLQSVKNFRGENNE